MSVPDYETLSCSLDRRVLTVTLNRPHRLNACTPTMRDELIAVVDRTDADAEVRALVLTGAGRAFCAGKDLAAGDATFDYESTGVATAGEVHRDNGGMIALRIWRSLKPVIVAVNGPAVGVGASMTLPADVRLIAEGARYGFVFTRRGIAPDGTSSWFLPRLVGVSTAARWVYSGRLIDAEEVVAAGLALGPYPAEDLLGAAHELADELTRDSAPAAVAAARQLLWRGLGSGSPVTAHLAESRAIYELGRRPDAYEGVQSFLDKRAARFGDDVADVPAWLDAPPPGWADEVSGGPA